MANNCLSDDDNRVDHKRMVHNEVERRRKVKINNWIYRLGNLLPGCSDDKKISKNGILERAVDYLKELQDNNEKLLRGKYSEVQDAEFQRMKERIRELELRNSELTQIIECSGVTVDLETIWQQRGKYSHKLESTSIIPADSHVSCALTTTTTEKKEKPLIPNKVNQCLKDSASTGSNLSPSERIIVVQRDISSLCSNTKDYVKTVIEEFSQNVTSNFNSQDLVTTPVLAGNTTTAVTQALPSLPIMSTTQHTSGNQQLLQQLPVLNYGNTVNIFPGLAGQGHPMIIINEQGVPLFQNVIPGQVLVHPITGQSTIYQGSNTNTQTSIIHGKPVVPSTTSANEMGTSNANSVLLNAVVNPSPSGLPAGIGTGPIIVNTGLGQPIIPNPNSGQGQVIVNTSSPQSFLTCGSKMSTLVNNSQIIFAPNSNTVNADTSNSATSALNSNATRQFIQMAPSIGAQNQFIVTNGTMCNKNTLQPSNYPTLNCNIPNQVGLTSIGSAATMPFQQTNQTAFLKTNAKNLPESHIAISHEHSLLPVINNAVVNQVSHISPHQNPVQILTRETCPTGTMVPNPASLPSALLLPNGQIIPVVSQPLLYPGSTTVNGNLLVTNNSQTSTSQGTNGNQNHTSQIQTFIASNSINQPKLTIQESTPTSSEGLNINIPSYSTNSVTSVMLSSQNESKPIQTTSEAVKKSNRKCHRVIKPKPAVNNSTNIQNSEPSNNTDGEKNETNSTITSDTPRAKSVPKSTSDLSYLLNTVSTSGSLSLGKSTDAATDILAKATESIFSTSVSESSPSVSNFYVCDNGDNTESNSIHSEILNRSESDIRTENNDKRDQAEEYFGGNHVENTSTTSNDILHDLVNNVYSSDDKDMPLLQPVSPATAIESNSSSEKNNSVEKPNEVLDAPKLSLMISDNNSGEGGLTTKRSQTSDQQGGTSNKRQKSEDVKTVNVIPKDFSDELVTSSTTTSSVNFLSITQLASSSFAMDGTLANENSPLESISPLLASPSKGISSSSYLTTTSSDSSSVTPSTASSVGNIQNISNNTNRQNIALYQENSSLGQQNHICNQSLVEIKSSNKLTDQCSSKITTNPLFPPEPVVTSSGNLISSVATTNDSEMCAVKNSPATYPSSQSVYATNNKNIISCPPSAPASVSHADGRTTLPHESYLHHFPSNSLSVQRQTNSNPLTSQQNTLGTNFITDNNSASCSSLTSVTYSVAPTLAESCNPEFTDSSRPSLLEPVVSSSSSRRTIVTTDASYSNNVVVPLSNQSFNVPDLLQNNMNGTNESLHFNTLRNNIGNTQESRSHCLGSLIDLPNDNPPLNVPSFNIGLSTQSTNHTLPHDSRNSVQMSMQTPISYSQNFFSQTIGLGRRPAGPTVNTGDGNKNKNVSRRRNNVDNTLTTTNLSPISGTSGRMINHPSLTGDLQQPSSLTQSVFPSHRSTATTISYSAEALIGQTVNFNSSQKQSGPQATSRPSLSYSAESLIQPPTNHRSHCSQNAQIHQGISGANNSLTSSYSSNNTTNLQPTFSCFLQPPSKTTNNVHSSTLTHFSSPVHNKNSCNHQQQHGEVSFSFILSQPDISQVNTSQMQTTPVYSNMLNYGTSTVAPSQNSKTPAEMQTPMLPQGDECAASRNHQQSHACPNLNFPTLSSVNSFSNHFSSEPIRNESANIGDNLSDLAKIPPDKTKPKQDNQTNKMNQTKSSKQTSQGKKKTLEEINLSNSIFETNRSVTPYFTIPNLSPPRNEAPTYLPNSNLFGVSPQRPVGSNVQQNKCDVARGPFNPLFSSRSQSSLNLNFPTPGFTVNHIHNNTSTQISNHSNVPNFNLSNIFPDINNAGDNVNAAPIKFHPGNPIMSAETQHHQASAPLYNRPVLHNGMSINSLLAHNPHGFDGRPPVPMPINNTMPVTFHSHAHTPSFNNVIPTLNFSMHEH